MFYLMDAFEVDEMTIEYFILEADGTRQDEDPEILYTEWSPRTESE